MANRKPYLMMRLSTGQITLEEARELFEVFARENEALAARLTEMARSAKGVRTVPEPKPGAPVTVPPNLTLEELLLLIGPAAGIFAAIQKRSRSP